MCGKTGCSLNIKSVAPRFDVLSLCALADAWSAQRNVGDVIQFFCGVVRAVIVILRSGSSPGQSEADAV